jgi:hypothetical protein
LTSAQSRPWESKGPRRRAGGTPGPSAPKSRDPSVRLLGNAPRVGASRLTGGAPARPGAIRVRKCSTIVEHWCARAPRGDTLGRLQPAGTARETGQLRSGGPQDARELSGAPSYGRGHACRPAAAPAMGRGGLARTWRRRRHVPGDVATNRDFSDMTVQQVGHPTPGCWPGWPGCPTKRARCGSGVLPHAPAQGLCCGRAACAMVNAGAGARFRRPFNCTGGAGRLWSLAVLR